MKKSLLLILLITGLSNAQIVNIPDVNFKARLLTANASNSIAQVFMDGSYANVVVDTNNDGEIQQSEALVIEALNINSEETPNKIADLTGLEFFTNLKVINCDYNEITSLDLTIFPNIYDVSCNFNLITTINIQGIPYINTLFCSNNYISTFDLTGVEYISIFYIANNQLTSFDATSKVFSILDISNNNLTSINLSNSNIGNIQVFNNPNLTSFIGDGLYIDTYLSLYNFDNLNTINLSNSNIVYLFLENIPAIQNINYQNSTILFFSGINTSLDEIDFSQMNYLREVVVSNCPISIIDLSQSFHLERVEITNNSNLSWVNIKNGIDEFPIIIQNNSNFSFLCVDETQLEYAQSCVSELVNSYCSFSPGGNYNTISGTLFFDSDNNGCDVNDSALQNVKLSLNDGINQGYTYSNFDGNYNFYVMEGDFTITPSFENPAWFSFSPMNSIVSFVDNNSNVVNQNFCITPLDIHNDVEVIFVPDNARPGFDTSYQISYRNKGNQTLSGTVQFAYEDDVLDYVSSTQSPDVQTTGSLAWNYTNLLPFEVRTITVVMNVNSPMETPAVNIGDQLDFTATINPISGDETPLDNVFGLKQIVVGSYDPNDKTCLEGSVVSTSKIGDYLHYNINFENTGTFPATFVVVKDMIDTTKFDMSTLQVLNASHPMETRIAGNKVEFIFDDINLGSNQHGNVVFKIKTKATLVEGNTVTNNANIYFDYNFPIETNTASTTFQVLSNGAFPTDYSVLIAPNPTKNNVNVNCNSSIKSIQLYDVQGRVLMTQLVNDSHSSIDVSNYTNGIYFVKVLTNEGSKVERISKE